MSLALTLFSALAIAAGVFFFLARTSVKGKAGW
jgi:hypothetical protein